MYSRNTANTHLITVHIHPLGKIWLSIASINTTPTIDKIYAVICPPYTILPVQSINPIDKIYINATPRISTIG